jgi:hypothetical protein
MTLTEWLALTGNAVVRDDAGGLCVTVDFATHDPNRSILWHLADVKVSSVCGPVVWLRRV